MFSIFQAIQKNLYYIARNSLHNFFLNIAGNISIIFTLKCIKIKLFISRTLQQIFSHYLKMHNDNYDNMQHCCLLMDE